MIALARGVYGSKTDPAFVKVIEAKSHSELWHRELPIGFYSPKWSSDSTRLLVGMFQFYVFDAVTGKQLYTVVDQNGVVASFGPEESIITASGQGIVNWWDLPSGRSLVSANIVGNSLHWVDRAGHILGRAGAFSERLFQLERPTIVRSV